MSTAYYDQGPTNIIDPTTGLPIDSGAGAANPYMNPWGVGGTAQAPNYNIMPPGAVTDDPNAQPNWPWGANPASPANAVPGAGGLAPGPQGPGAAPPSIVPPSNQLSKNPMLPQHPLGAYTDAQYEADHAALQNQISKQYADLLQQLGYVDPSSGQFIPGSVETEANRQRTDLARSMGLATEDVDKQMQQAGTLFSGIRGTQRARAQYPFASGLAQIAANLPVQLQQLYEQAAGLVNDYTVGQNQLLAGAAARRSAAVTANPAAPVPPTGGPPGGETVTPPPPSGPIIPPERQNPTPPPANLTPGFGTGGYLPPSTAGIIRPTTPQPGTPVGAPGRGAVIE